MKILTGLMLQVFVAILVALRNTEDKLKSQASADQCIFSLYS